MASPERAVLWSRSWAPPKTSSCRTRSRCSPCWSRGLLPWVRRDPRGRGGGHLRTRSVGGIGAGLAFTLAMCWVVNGQGGAFRFDSTQEATLAAIPAAMNAGELSCRRLGPMALERIAASDQQGPALNALVVVNPTALVLADALDARFAQAGFTGPLHGIPIIVKDDYNTVGLPTSAGALSVQGSMPPDDAFQVRKLQEAGAIVLAKSNMAEFAWSPFETVGSLLPGYTKNPYALNRVPAGSIHGPSAHTSVAGIRSTMGLTSRDGSIPLFLDKEIGGPLARTGAEAGAVFEVIASYDPADPV